MRENVKRLLRLPRRAAGLAWRFGKRAVASLRYRIPFAVREVRNAIVVSRNDLAADLVASGSDLRRFVAERRRTPRHYVEASRGEIEALRASAPARAAETLRQAERVLGHEFDLLGSGSFRPVDPDRPAKANGYAPIDWTLDPVRNARFRNDVPYKDWKLFEMRPPNGDIKFPWELARAQHLPLLGQAWLLSRDSRFAVEIFDQIDDFAEANPVGVGVNWTCTMDVAIRAANWAIALALVGDCDVVPDVRRQTAYAHLFEQGRFAFQNLENLYEVTSNHFLSNVVGLHVLAAEFAGTPQAKAWDAFCRKALEEEIVVQVNPDGSDYESSVPYHRLVTELFLASARLAQFQGRPLSAGYNVKLGTMLDFLRGVQRPDGLMPVIGDADDGRFHIFTDYGLWNRQDARHLYAPAALTLGRADLLALAGEAGRWEAIWWGFSLAEAKVGSAAAPDEAKLYADIGVAVARRGGSYLAVTNGRVGTKGFGNHKHNELLGFEWHVAGAPVVIDAGSYVYTSDFDARNGFRSTAAHNTLAIDGAEQNDFKPEWLFRMFETAEPEHLLFEAGERVVYEGRHKGFLRTPAQAEHRRRFTFDPALDALEIVDRVEGASTAAHRLSWRFLLAPGVAVEPREGHVLLAPPNGARLRFDHPPELKPAVVDAWASPSYGVREPTRALDLATDAPVDGRPWRFSFRRA
jgi:hypothetical protein